MDEYYIYNFLLGVAFVLSIIVLYILFECSKDYLWVVMGT
jgi:hypothetical protein